MTLTRLLVIAVRQHKLAKVFVFLICFLSHTIGLWARQGFKPFVFHVSLDLREVLIHSVLSAA